MLLDVETVYVFICFSSTSVSSDLKALYKSVIIIIIIMLQLSSWVTCVIQNEIGFVGLGNMGAHMARNLMKKNWKVMVYDVNEDAVKAAVQDGKQT